MSTDPLVALAHTCPAQPFFCEENAWLRCRAAIDAGFAARAVWITNARRAVPVWSQRAASDVNEPVLWDYHVVALVGPIGEAGDLVVLDADCTAGPVLPLAVWRAASFPIEVPGHEPSFRVVDGARFIAHFASDRRHMRDAAGTFLHPAPPWPAIHAERGSNLDAYLDVDDDALGRWSALAGLAATPSPQRSPR